MNPLDLRGPVFLALYATLFGFCLVVAWLLRRTLSGPHDSPSPRELELSPDEVAYLAKGPRGPVTAAIARLVHAGAIAIKPGSRFFLRTGHEPPPGHSEIDGRVWQTMAHSPSEDATAVASSAEGVTVFDLEAIRSRLEQLGLLVEAERARLARWLPVLLLAGLAVFGWVKVVVGLWRGRPVFFLVIASAVVVLAAVSFNRPIFASRRGNKVLATLRRRSAALKSQAKRRAERLSGADVALASALFGLGVFGSGALAELEPALQPLRKDGGGGCGSGCGASCGGGCGGGGCGGCGG